MAFTGKQAVYYWIPLLAYGTLIFFFSSLSFPNEYLPGNILLNDKFSHALEYGVLGILFYRVFQAGIGQAPLPQPVFWAIAATTMFGITDEIHQYFVPFRNSDGLDLLADFTGATIAIVSCRWYQAMKLES